MHDSLIGNIFIAYEGNTCTYETLHEVTIYKSSDLTVVEIGSVLVLIHSHKLSRSVAVYVSTDCFSGSHK